MVIHMDYSCHVSPCGPSDICLLHLHLAIYYKRSSRSLHGFIWLGRPPKFVCLFKKIIKVVAACSLGCAVANPLFGYWNQKTLSTKKPLSVGFLLCAIGNLLYGLLPMLPIFMLSPVLLVSRFLTGFGAGESKLKMRQMLQAH